MENRIYTIEEIKKLVFPVAVQYGVERIYLFGSYARGSATPESDIDFRVDKGKIKGLIALGGLYNELAGVFGKKLDLLTTGSLEESFLNSIKNEEIVIYERAQRFLRKGIREYVGTVVPDGPYCCHKTAGR